MVNEAVYHSEIDSARAEVATTLWNLISTQEIQAEPLPQSFEVPAAFNEPAVEAHEVSIAERRPFTVRNLGEKARAAWRSSTLGRRAVTMLGIGALAASPAPALATQESITAHLSQAEPLPENVLSIPYGEWQGTGGYPWVDATPLPGTDQYGSYLWGYQSCPPSDPNCMSQTVKFNGQVYGVSDPFGKPLRECDSYTLFKLQQRGVDPERFDLIAGNQSVQDTIALAKKMDIHADETPTPGAALLAPAINHVWYIESVNGSDVTVSDYNGGGGGAPGNWGVEVLKNSDFFPGSVVIHYDDPINTSKPFFKVIYDPRLKDTVSQKHSMSSLLLRKNGNAEEYGPDFKKKWESKTKGKHVDYMAVEKGKHGKHYLAFRTARAKLVKRFSIGKATNVKLRDDGSFRAMKGARSTRVIASAAKSRKR
jgi:hypothetical protein